MIKHKTEIPIVGACVVHFEDHEKKHFGRVIKVTRDNPAKVQVHWFTKNKTEWLIPAALRSGFKVGMDVLYIISQTGAPSMGEGVVLKSRVVANYEQVLVEFPVSGKKVWLPWQGLRQIKGVKHRFILGEKDGCDAAERLRLRTLAWVLKLWNENTGSLAKFDIDPLPHQIHLVHHILASGDLNWLIADDVGLGKTIETGLLLAALRERKQIKRILLITPAGLTKQWQEELFIKFGMGDFLIYGDDFTITEPRHWKMYDCVIGSMDRLKNDDHLELLMQAEPWDIVIFDEAHRLTRRQYGVKYSSSQRFELARELRARTESMLLLTATPHQGQQDSFAALLELLHPERKQELLSLSLNPEILQDMVFRNRKADVTDLEGNFIFHGKTTRALKVPISEEAREFDHALQFYLQKGYQSGEEKGQTGRAIGFVMTVYRKLAASSIAAIYEALVRRRKRLQKELKPIPDMEFDRRAALDALDARFEGESEEFITSTTSADEFFQGELELLNRLIKIARQLKYDDRKLSLFLEQVIEPIMALNPNEKVLVFSEYRGTQEWLLKALNERFGNNKTMLINGSMDLNERRAAIACFERDAQFLLSTEAGGEGINLQQRCHIMVNYDLPWNPMRLVQRIGRLYRYGQKKRVVVFNIHSPDTLDEQIIEILYTRLEQVVVDMASIGAEFNDSMKDDVFGEIADLIEVEDILKQAVTESISRTAERIDEALKQAQSAADKQSILFAHVAGFSKEEMKDNLVIDETHLRAFIGGMFVPLGIVILDITHQDQVWTIKLPEEVMRAVGTRRSRHSICFNRELAATRDDLLMMDTDAWLLEHLFSAALDYDFGGKTAAITGLDETPWMMASILRWQDNHGRRMRQEFAAVCLDAQGNSQINSAIISDWLLVSKQLNAEFNTSERDSNELNYKMAEKAVFKRLASLSTKKLIPDGVQWISGAWVDGQLSNLESK
ncbi:helicase-related protein [Shewanella litoralis]|uniref:Helicase n=1 Tax=Shewanella litoralis TaxID=2282700 RepID=A0ABQ2RB02_9GAMM|nr:helicase-related protein [Shewanella litoralis]GGQ22799.1 helicase [Shewanella litoralis]